MVQPITFLRNLNLIEFGSEAVLACTNCAFVRLHEHCSSVGSTQRVVSMDVWVVVTDSTDVSLLLFMQT